MKLLKSNDEAAGEEEWFVMLFKLFAYIFCTWFFIIFGKDADGNRYSDFWNRLKKRWWSIPLNYWIVFFFFFHTLPKMLTAQFGTSILGNVTIPLFNPWFLPLTNICGGNPLSSFIVFGIVIPSVLVLIYYYFMERHKYRTEPEAKLGDRIYLPTTKRGVTLGIETDDLNAGALVIGGTGTGKTHCINSIVYQLPHDKNDCSSFIFFDPKGDYHTEFGKGGDIVIGLSGSTHSWNIFSEAISEQDFSEMSAELFVSDKRDFWNESAEQLFAAILKMLNREAKKQGTTPTNKDLVAFLQSKTNNEIYDTLNNHEDLRAVASIISPQAAKQSIGVLSSMNTIINKIFIGNFAQDDKPEFSIREYMQNPEGRTLFLEFDVTRAHIIAPMFRLLLDTAIKYAIAKGSEGRRKNFIIDEMQFLPYIQIGSLLNLGRAYSAFTVSGLQSIAQLNAAYGKKADAIVAGNKHTIAFRSGDKETTDFIRSKLGRIQRKQVSTHVVSQYQTEQHTTVSEEHEVSERELQTMDVGECWFISETERIKVRLKPYDEIKKMVDAHRELFAKKERIKSKIFMKRGK